MAAAPPSPPAVLSLDTLVGKERAAQSDGAKQSKKSLASAKSLAEEGFTPPLESAPVVDAEAKGDEARVAEAKETDEAAKGNERQEKAQTKRNAEKEPPAAPPALACKAPPRVEHHEDMTMKKRGWTGLSPFSARCT